MNCGGGKSSKGKKAGPLLKGGLYLPLQELKLTSSMGRDTTCTIVLGRKFREWTVKVSVAGKKSGKRGGGE